MKISRLNKHNIMFKQGSLSFINTLTTGSKQFDSNKIVGETPLFQELSTAYKWMSYTGLLYLQNTAETGNERKLIQQKVYIAYQWFLDVLIIINALRLFAVYHNLQDMGSFLVAFVNHIFMILLGFFSGLRPYLEKHISLFIIKIFRHKMNNEDESSISRLVKFIRFYVLFSCTYSLMSSIGFNIVAPPFYPSPIDSHTYPFTHRSTFFYPALLLFGFASTLGTLRVHVLMAHSFAMCHFLTLEYIHLAQKIRSQITAIKDDEGFSLEAHRARFEALNGLLKHLNRISNISLMLVIFFCIFELCMMIYGLLQYIVGIDFYSISFSAAFGMLFTGLLIGSGIFLSSSVSSFDFSFLFRVHRRFFRYIIENPARHINLIYHFLSFLLLIISKSFNSDIISDGSVA